MEERQWEGWEGGYEREMEAGGLLSILRLGDCI